VFCRLSVENMDDKDARIAARRDRVENRHVALEDAPTSDVESKEVLKGAARVAESLASLDAKKVQVHWPYVCTVLLHPLFVS
jgi:hypothetical protein